jgi:eukaryotic-like serine/threonine-protein kinase
MPANPQCLSVDEMHVFLDGELSQAEDSSVIEHLDGCPKCRAALEESAGGPQWLGHVKEFLADVDPACPAEEPGEEQEIAPEPFLIADRLTFLAPSEDPRMLGRMGIYEVAGVIGYGAMGVVLKAFEPSLNRYVALKVLWPHLAINGAARQRFAREARAAAAVVHEHVVPIYAVDEFQGLPYIVLRYVPGRSLHERIARQGKLQVDEVLRIGRQIAAALDAAHAQGLVHRDVKPANILLENGIERVLVTDFGLARAADDASLTHSGMVAGTPQFMAPEQARGDVVDQRSDLFSFGSVLYTMCAGHPPFRAETLVGVLTRICGDAPRPLREINPAVPEWLAAFVAKLMVKDRNHRFQSAAETAQILERELAHLQNPASVTRPDRRWAKRPWRPTALALGVLAGVLLLSIVIAGLGQGWLFSHPEAGRNLGSADSPSNVQGTAEVWRGNAAMVEFSELQNDADRLEQSLRSRGDGSAAGPDEWEQVRRGVQSLEDELEQDDSGL